MKILKKDKLKITKRPLRGDDGFKTFSIRIKNEIVEEIDNISGMTNRSRNEIISVLLKYAIDNCEIEEK